MAWRSMTKRMEASHNEGDSIFLWVQILNESSSVVMVLIR